MDNPFYLYKGRLAMYHDKGTTKQYWKNMWQKHQTDIWGMLEHYRKGYLDDYEKIFEKYISKNLPVLEAGCGLGKYVASLQSKGYQVEGVDYEENVVKMLNKVAPDLKIRQGDIYNLDLPDNYYGSYISLGVLEHNLELLEKGLLEARRVLHSEGVALISVPLLNDARSRLQEKVVPAPEKLGLNFYQTYFSAGEFKQFLEKAGFEIIEISPYAVYSGITRDYPLGKWLEEKKCFHWRIRSLLIRTLEKLPVPFRMKLAHMCMYVCKTGKSNVSI